VQIGSVVVAALAAKGESSGGEVDLKHKVRLPRSSCFSSLRF